MVFIWTPNWSCKTPQRWGPSLVGMQRLTEGLTVSYSKQLSWEKQHNLPVRLKWDTTKAWLQNNRFTGIIHCKSCTLVRHFKSWLYFCIRAQKVLWKLFAMLNIKLLSSLLLSKSFNTDILECNVKLPRDVFMAKYTRSVHFWASL